MISPSLHLHMGSYLISNVIKISRAEVLNLWVETPLGGGLISSILDIRYLHDIVM